MRRNSAAWELRHAPARHLLTVVHRHPRLALTLVLLTYLLVAGGASVVPVPAWAPAAPDQDDYFRDLQAINLGIFGAQATLLGLVYPLVIGLVGLLFEARSSRGNRLQVYFRETEALSVGGMSLALVMMIGLQLLAYAIIPADVAVAVTVLNTLWFSANLAALGFFVIRSLDFVRPARRHALMKAFLANSAWSTQLRDGMMLNQWSNAVHYEHLPKSASEASAIIVPFGFDPPALTRSLARPRVLADVHLGVLAAVLRGRPAERPLSFSPWPGVTYDKEVVLARASVPDLSAIERFLIRFAFVFAPVQRREAPPSTKEILSEAGADLLSLMEAGRYAEFEALMAETIDLHRLLYALGEEPQEPGRTPFNYGALKLEDTRSFAWEWARGYRDLLVRAGDHLTSDDRYFESCAYIAPKVMRQAREVAPFEAAQAVFNLPATLFRALVDGAARRHAEASPAPVVRGTLFTPAGPGAAFYRSSWLRFVGGWESLGDAVSPRSGANWEDLRAAAPGVSRHLHDSALRVAQAAKAGERLAIGWTVDMLLKWREKILLRWGGYHGHALIRPVVTLDLLGRPWDKVAPLPLMRFGEAVIEAGVFDAAVENAWLDTQMVLACSLIGLFGEAGAAGRFDDGPAEAAGALFRNQNFDPSASSHPHGRPLTTTAILQAILRLIGAGDRFEEGYGYEIGELADEIDRLEGPNYVSARGYSWAGQADVHEQASQQLLLLAASLQKPGRGRSGGPAVDDDLKALLLPADDRVRRRLLDHLAALRKAAKELDPSRSAMIMATLRAEACDVAELSDRLAAVVAIIETCETEIHQVRETEIAAAPIDPTRLEAIAEAAAATAFSAVDGAFPLPMFKTVAFVDDDLLRFSHRLRTDKGRYTAPLMREPFGNEAEYWTTSLHDLVGAVVFNDVVKARPAVRRAPRSAAGYWTAIKAAVEAVEEAGQTPIIVRNNRGEPQCLTEWHFDFSGSKRPADLRIQQVEGRGDGYDFDLNDTPVYSSPWAGAATWVLGREALARVDFQRLIDGRAVEVGFEADASDVWAGVAHATFARRVSVAAGPIWRIGHPPSKVPR